MKQKIIKLSNQRAVKKQKCTRFLFLFEQSTVKFDITNQSLSELDTTEDHDLRGQFPESLSVVSNLKISIFSL